MVATDRLSCWVLGAAKVPWMHLEAASGLGKPWMGPKAVGDATEARGVQQEVVEVRKVAPAALVSEPLVAGAVAAEDQAMSMVAAMQVTQEAVLLHPAAVG